MAKRIEFGKFLIIGCTAGELMNAVGSDLCLCDDCGKAKLPSDKGYYIAVLSMWFCEHCFKMWTQRAEWYPEDADVERRNYEFYAPRFGLECQ